MAARRCALLAGLMLCFLGVAGFVVLSRARDIAGEVRIGDQAAPDVRVRWQGESHSVVTDATGRFRLPRSPRQRLTAAKPGYLIATALARNPQLSLQPLPLLDNDAYEWIDPRPHAELANNCGNCHKKIYDDWSTSAHAQSANGVYFLGVFADLLAQKPEGAGVCATCHAPTFRDPTFEYDFRRSKGVAAQGVHCDYCHKVADTSPDPRRLRFGRDGYALLRPFDNQQFFFGPLDDAFREGESFAHAPIFKRSEYCASCHDGVIFGVAAYGTYSEWLESPAKAQGQQCQSCHMTPTGLLTNLAPRKGGIERDPWTLSSHRLEGATPAMLQRCLKVEVSRVSRPEGERVEVQVRADNVGHQVPTGFLDRHLALVVEAFDKAGRPVALREGTKLPAFSGAGIGGQAGWLYATILRGQSGPQPSWLPHDERTDTRLRPGQTDRRAFLFAPGVERLRVRLLYRRFWPEMAARQGWPDNEWVVVDMRQSRVAE